MERLDRWILRLAHDQALFGVDLDCERCVSLRDRAAVNVPA